MLRDARSFWTSATTAIANINENINTVLENFEAENQAGDSDAEDTVGELMTELESYKSLLNDAQMQHFELSKQSRILVAEKEAELQHLREASGGSAEAPEGDAAVESSSLAMKKVLAEKAVVELSLTEVQEHLKSVLGLQNEYRVTKASFEETALRHSTLRTAFSELKVQAESDAKQKGETIENLVAEYSNLAAESELRQERSDRRVFEVIRENEVLVTKMHALEHSISELADRSVDTHLKGSASPLKGSGSSGSLSGPTAEADLREARSKVVNLQFDLKERDEELTKLRAALTQKELAPAVKIDVESVQLAKLQRDSENQIKDISRLTDEKREAEAAGKLYLERCKNLQQELEAATREHAKSNKDESMSRLEFEEKLKATGEAHAQEQQRWTADVQRLQQEVEGLASSSCVLEGQKVEHSAALHAQQTESAALAAAVREKQMHIDGQETAHAAALQALQLTASAAVTAVQEKQAQLDGQETAYRAQLAAALASVSSTSDEAATQLQSQLQASQQQQDELASLMSKLNMLQDEKRAGEALGSEATAMQEARLSKATADNESLQQQQTQSGKETETLRAQCASLGQQVASLEAAKEAAEVRLQERAAAAAESLKQQSEGHSSLALELEAKHRDVLQMEVERLQNIHADESRVALAEAAGAATAELTGALEAQEASLRAEAASALSSAEQSHSDATAAALAERVAALEAAAGAATAELNSALEAQEASLRAEAAAALSLVEQEHVNATATALTERVAALAMAAAAATVALASSLEAQDASLRSEAAAALSSAEQQHSDAIAATLAEKASEKADALAALSKADSDALDAALVKLGSEMDASHRTAVESLTRERDEQQAAALSAAAQKAAACLQAVQSQAAAQIAELEGCIQRLERELTSIEAHHRALTEAALTSLREQKDQECIKALEALRHELQSFVDSAHAERDTHMENYTRERKLRKKLHNKLLDLQGNIRVVCRVRPVLEMERRSGEGVDVTEIPNDEELFIQRDAQAKTRYEYDKVYKQDSSQEEVFGIVQPLCVSVLDGFNVCIFAYGQTGSGKTFTMEGYGADRGVSPRAIAELLNQAEIVKESVRYSFTLSMLEIYNETILDLLGPPAKEKTKLDIRQTADGNQVVGLTETKVSTVQQVEALMEKGKKNRAVGSHDMNEHSSRSHSIITLVCRGENLVDSGTTFGKLHLIDLAGSERVGKTDAVGEQLKEAQAINKSLSALGEVINALGNKKATHVPYRNSKLTFLLQDSLGGNSKVLTFVNISPAVYNMGETICSLNFASRCRSTELGQAKKQTSEGEGSSSKAPRPKPAPLGTTSKLSSPSPKK